MTANPTNRNVNHNIPLLSTDSTRCCRDIQRVCHGWPSFEAFVFNRNQRSERPIFTRSDLRSFFAYISLPNISGNTTSSFHLSNADYIELFTSYTSLMKNSLKRLGSIRNLQSKNTKILFFCLPFPSLPYVRFPEKTKKNKKNRKTKKTKDLREMSGLI